MGDPATRPTYLHGFAWNLAFNVLTKVVSPIAGVLLVHRLPPEVFGMYLVVQSVLMIADTLRDAGIGQLFLKDQRPDANCEGEYVAASLKLGALLFLFLTAAAWPVARFYRQPELAWGVVMAGGALGLYFLATVPFTKLLRGGDLKSASGIEAAATVSATLYGVAAVYSGGGFLALTAQIVVRAVIYALLAFRCAPTKLRIGGDRVQDRHSSRALTATGLLWMGFSMGDQPLIAKALGFAASGVYGGAKMIVQTADVLARPILQTTNIAFAHRAANSEEVGRTLHKALSAYLVAIVPVYVLVAFNARPLIDVLLPRTYQAVAEVLPAMCLYGAAVYPGSFSSSALVVSGRAEVPLRHWIVGYLVAAATLSVTWPEVSLVRLAWGFALLLTGVNVATLVVALLSSPVQGRALRNLTSGSASVGVLAAIAFGASQLPITNLGKVVLAFLLLPVLHAIMVGSVILGRPAALATRSGVADVWKRL